MNELKNLKKTGTKVIIIVDKNSECSSSCIALFTIGDERIVHSNSKWVFHSPFVFKPGYDVDNDKGIFENEKEWIRNKIVAAREFFYKSILTVDKDFAEFLNKNYFTKNDGRKVVYTGSELSNISKTYVTKII